MISPVEDQCLLMYKELTEYTGVSDKTEYTNHSIASSSFLRRWPIAHHIGYAFTVRGSIWSESEQISSQICSFYENFIRIKHPLNEEEDIFITVDYFKKGYYMRIWSQPLTSSFYPITSKFVSSYIKDFDIFIDDERWKIMKKYIYGRN
jgi:hypothetical protein